MTIFLYGTNDNDWHDGSSDLLRSNVANHVSQEVDAIERL